MNILAPPLPSNPAEVERVNHTRMRRRIMYGEHQELIKERLVASFGGTRAAAVRIVDMTSNPAHYVASQLAALYREIPEVAPPDGAEDTAAAVAEAGWWQLAQRVQRDTIAFNDMLVRVDVDPSTGEPSFRLVPPDLVELVSSPLKPAQPLAVKEWISDPDDPAKWVQLHTDPRARIYRALDENGVDVTERVLGERSFSGDAYPFLDGDRPLLPYTAYHACESGYLLDPRTGQEAFEGTLMCSMFYSFFGHNLRQSSWAQRFMVGARPAGGDMDPSGRRREVVADPSTVVNLEALEEGGTFQVGQWSVPISPEQVYAPVERYERRIVESFLSAAGVSRRESDVRSAASLAVSKEAQRDSQRSYEPVFRRSDLRLLGLVSALRGEPSTGWRIHYRSLPRDASELAAEIERMEKLVALGLLDRVSAYQLLHPGLTDAEAEAAVKRIAEINARLNPARP